MCVTTQAVCIEAAGGEYEKASARFVPSLNCSSLHDTAVEAVKTTLRISLFIAGGEEQAT